MSFVTKIAILFVGFISLIITLVVKCHSTNVDLVSDDYYTQELKYQEKLNAMNNEKSLPHSISHVVADNSITLTIDSSLVSDDFSGDINFFRPSDASKDVKMKMNFNHLQQVISTDALVRGVYKMQLSWSSHGKQYYKENVIFVN